MSRPAADALLERETKWKESLTKADQAGVYADSLVKWTELAIKAIAADKAKRGERNDSWSNLLTGVGTARDKTVYTKFLEDCQLSFAVLEALYHNDDMAARIADSVPEQLFREGYELHDEDDSDDADEVEAALEELGTDDAFESSFIWGRVYGGAPLIVGVDDGQEDEKPVNEAQIQKVRYLTALDRYAVFPIEWYDDPAAPKFGEPSVYQILIPGGYGPLGLQSLQVGARVHETRLIMFPGARTSLRRKRQNFGWDDSVFQRVYQVLMKFGLDWASATHLLSDASQGVLKMAGLIEALGGNQKEEIAKRGEYFDMHRSTLRTVLLDAGEGEDYTRITTNFSGIPDMLDRTAQRLAAAARMPVTVLMGTSPAGLNATGDSDIRNWYDQIASMQRRQVKPRLQRLIKLVTLASEGPTGGKEWKGDICFKPLWQLSPLEEATRRKTIADKDEAEITAGIVTAEEVAKSRYGARGYSIDTSIDLELRDALTEEDGQVAQLGAGKMQAAKELAEATAANKKPVGAGDDDEPAKPSAG